MASRSKYSSALKERLVKAYLRGGIGHKSLSLKHGICHTQLRFWINLYKIHGARGFDRPYRGHFTAEYKLKVLKRMWSEKLSSVRVAAIFNLCSPEGVRLWERQYREGGIEALRPSTTRPRGMSDRKDKQPPSPERADGERSKEDLIAELQQLRMENAYLKKLDALVRARQSPKGRK